VRWLGLELAYLWQAGYSGDRQGGPCPPTGKCTNTDYVYVMEFQGDKILQMTKIWNAVGHEGPGLVRPIFTTRQTVT